jgi:hypothetical protein
VPEGDNVCYCYGVVAFASFVLDLGGDGDTIEVTRYLLRSIVVGCGEKGCSRRGWRTPCHLTLGIYIGRFSLPPT